MSHSSPYIFIQGGWSAILAGLAAGSVSILDHPERRRTLSLFVLARALGALVVTLHRRGHLPSVPYFATLVFATCQSLIIMCMAHFPELLPRGYYRSILNWSMYYTNEKLEVCEQFGHYNSSKFSKGLIVTVFMEKRLSVKIKPTKYAWLYIV